MSSRRGTAVLEAPERRYATEAKQARGSRRGAGMLDAPERALRRDLSEDFAGDLHQDSYEDEALPQRRGAVRVRFGGLPRSGRGWIVSAVFLLLSLAACAGAGLMLRDLVLRNEKFVIPSASFIEFEGNRHATRAQLLSVFGGDLERNIFQVPLEERRAALKQTPWVAHATVMRLLPNRLRVSIVERTPVAFVREGNHVELVDVNGVLLNMPVGSAAKEHYSFPVVTGIVAGDPLSTRSARMKIFSRFTSELDAGGEKISEKLSEVDLSDPEDVKALIPDHSSDVLVHFGEDDFLGRYRRYEQHLAEWRTVYPRLSAVDMRYERQVVLEMQPGSGVPMTSSTNAGVGESSSAGAGETAAASSGAAAHAEKSSGRIAPAAHSSNAAHVAKSAGTEKRASHGKTWSEAASRAAHKSTVKAKSRTTVKQPVARPSQTTTLYHPPQGMQR